MVHFPRHSLLRSCFDQWARLGCGDAGEGCVLATRQNAVAFAAVESVFLAQVSPVFRSVDT